jgi:hypothetical protein
MGRHIGSGRHMDIQAWLRRLGLGQYEVAFRDNAIDEKILLSLTAEDLKDLDVVLVGHRRTLLLDRLVIGRRRALTSNPDQKSLEF